MYYAVRKGHKIGIFDNWPEAQAATTGFSGPEFKKFKSKEEAEAYLENRDVWAEQVSSDNSDGYLVAFTDGSFDKDLKRYSYGVVLVKPDGTEESVCGFGSNELYLDSNNIIGEIFGVINALDWAVAKGFEKVKIYHDLEGLSKWASGEWKANVKASQMFVSIYKEKFDGVLSVEFVKVPGHSNVSLNEKADQLAKSALIDKKRVPVEGAHWYSIPYFSKDDFEAFAEIVKESDGNIAYNVTDYPDKSIYRFTLNSDSVTVTLFKTGKHSLLVQGKNTYLFQVIATTIVELDDDCKVERILGNAYRISIKNDVVERTYKPVENGLPANYPAGIKRLLKQAAINLNYYIQSEDYSQYAFPALRALEGHIKYLISVAGGPVSRQFSCFNRATPADPYYFTAPLTDASKKSCIETCYNYYKSQRDTSFHFGDLIGMTDTTRFMATKQEADEVIEKCIELINTQR